MGGPLLGGKPGGRGGGPPDGGPGGGAPGGPGGGARGGPLGGIPGGTLKVVRLIIECHGTCCEKFSEFSENWLIVG